IPYTIRTALNLDPDDTRILSPIIDLSHGRRLMERSMKKFGKTLGVSADRIYHAISVAEKTQMDYHAKIQERGEEILGRLQNDDRAVIIISRPYNGCDNALNLDLPKKLSNIGFTAIPMDFLPVEKETDHPDWPNMYWRHGKRILRAADIIRGDQRLSSIFITNFGCGPDSFITHFYRRKMGDKPYLQLEVDEHSADAGAITRVEAFQDSLENARSDDHHIVSAIEGAYAIPQKAKRTLYIPSMSDHSYALMAAFQHHQVNAQVLPPSDEETLYWGRKFTSGKECFPCIVTTGDMVKHIKSPDFDSSRTAFFMPGGEGPCRFGQYNVLQRMILNDLGCPDVPIFAPVQDDDFYAELGMVGKGLARRMWRGIVAIDIIDKLLREIRPYEVNPGQTDKVYQQALETVINGIRQDNLFKVLKGVRSNFESIPIDRISVRPIIGVVGEFFVRSSSFCNKNIAQAIEKAGGEAWFSPVTEWFLYLNYLAKRQKRLSKDYLELVNLSLTDVVQRQDEHKIYKMFKGLLRNHHEPSISQILKLSQPYIDSSFEGEAILSIGKSIDFFHKGLAGIVNTMPFTCMPGTIVNAMLKRFRNEHLQIPCLNMAYDGQEESNAMTRLEAFMYQAKQFQANHSHNDSRAKSTTAPLYASTVGPHTKNPLIINK
ncbi:MAG: acyl-CoA dehydratase activase-related protein, partial [Desulfatiglandales bacterium]